MSCEVDQTLGNILKQLPMQKHRGTTHQQPKHNICWWSVLLIFPAGSWSISQANNITNLLHWCIKC